MTQKPRYLLPDLGRSLALLGMAIFHFCLDLTFFGFLSQATFQTSFFWYFPRIVAGSFLFLAGLGLWLAHGRRILWPQFAKRQLRIMAAAALVSLASYLAMPQLWIFYGILHAIAVSSVLGLAFLRLPAAALIALAAFVFTLPWVWSDPFFGGWLVWSGLAGYVPLTLDFEPLFPWFAPFLAGIAAGRLAQHFDLWRRTEPEPRPLLQALAAPGRHSLAIYLLHQPLLIGLVAAAAWISSRIG